MANYDIYMLRIWTEKGPIPDGLKRVTLENTKTGSRVGFTSWENLIRFLDGRSQEVASTVDK